jgi:hypothetical protein
MTAIKLTDLTPDAMRENGIYKAFAQYEEVLRSMFAKPPRRRPIAFVYGSPGFGKTYAAKGIAHAEGVKAEIIRPANPQALVDDLWHHTQIGTDALIFDDYGSLISSPQVGEIIKSGWDVDQGRILTWKNLKPRRDRPDKFKLKAALIWSSNLDLKSDKIKGAVRNNIEALESRGGHPISINGRDEDKFVYTLHLVMTKEMLRGKVSRKAVVAAVNFFNDNRCGRLNIKDLSPRGIKSIAEIIHHHPYPTSTDQPDINKEKRELNLSCYLSGKFRNFIPGFEHRLNVINKNDWIEEAPPEPPVVIPLRPTGLH